MKEIAFYFDGKLFHALKTEDKRILRALGLGRLDAAQFLHSKPYLTRKNFSAFIVSALCD